MKEATAKLKNLTVTPRKMRSISGVIRGYPVNRALAEVKTSNLRGSEELFKLIKSAVTNAKALKMDENKLYIKTLLVNEGPMLKRILPRARGSADRIEKKMSHITLVLAEKENIDNSQYLIPEAPKKKKKPTEPKEKLKPKTPTPEDTAQKTEKKPGFFKKVFRRKSI